MTAWFCLYYVYMIITDGYRNTIYMVFLLLQIFALESDHNYRQKAQLCKIVILMRFDSMGKSIIAISHAADNYV